MKIEFDNRYRKASEAHPGYKVIVDPAHTFLCADELSWLIESSAKCVIYKKGGVKIINFTDIKWFHLICKDAVYFEFENKDDELLYKLMWA